MSNRSLVPPNSDATKTADPAKLVSRYKQLRAVSLQLNHKLLDTLSKNVFDTGGRKLGILRDGILVFDSVDESSILMDYCIYNVRQNGLNAVDRYLIHSPPDEDSDEMACLRAMQHAVYSLFAVESVERGLGITVRDSLSDESILIVDIAFSISAQPGQLFASRLTKRDGFSMTCGAALPIAVVPKDKQQSVIEMLVASLAPDEHGEFDPAPLIRACLADCRSSNIRYHDALGATAERSPAMGRRRSAKVSRNSRCPCGSGKKFKHCCIR